MRLFLSTATASSIQSWCVPIDRLLIIYFKYASSLLYLSYILQFHHRPTQKRNSAQVGCFDLDFKFILLFRSQKANDCFPTRRQYIVFSSSTSVLITMFISATATRYASITEPSTTPNQLSFLVMYESILLFHYFISP